ncbi:MAG TPA: hypothetical protein VH062_02410 [Polyangiaceae bacterium]|jgi:hypothetical protein|nr:hypothetical protein [Polyangiaceae bacterium]
MPASQTEDESEVAILGECRDLVAKLREERNFLLVDLAESRETNARLNRRCQVYEAGLAEKVSLHPTAPNFGRALAIAVAEARRTEVERLRARVAELEGGGLS